MPTKSQIDRAGERLRKAETPSEADREIYNAHRASYLQPLNEVVQALRELASGMPVTHRLKRLDATVHKLRRQRTRLSSIEDIAGCRVVLPTWREQRELFDRVRGELEVVRERDYQRDPRHGYRALHAVVHVDDQPVEIQLRTELEDRWANFVDQLAQEDLDIKYGGGSPLNQVLLQGISAMFEDYDAIKILRHRIISAFSTLEGAETQLADFDRFLDELSQEAPTLEAGTSAEAGDEDAHIGGDTLTVIAGDTTTVLEANTTALQTVLDGGREYIGTVRAYLEHLAAESEAWLGERGRGNT